MSRATEAERVVAIGRLILALYLLVAVVVDRSLAEHSLALPLSAGYTLYASILAVVALRRRFTSGQRQVVRHFVDLLVVSGIVLLTDGTNSPFVHGFIFSMVCSALLFDTRATAATAAGTLLVYIVLVAISALVLRPGEFGPDRFVVRLGFLTVIGALILQLKHHEERLRRDYRSLAAWPKTMPFKLEPMLDEALRRASEILHVRRAVLVWEDALAPHINIAMRDAGNLEISTEPADRFTVVDRSARIVSFVVTPHDAAIVRTETLAVREFGSNPLTEEFRKHFAVTSAVGARFAGDAVAGWLVALDRDTFTTDDMLLCEIVGGFLQSRLEQFHVTERARSTAVAEERLRFARDLHDGILQSLSGTAFHLQMLRELMKRDPSAALYSLDDVEEALNQDQRDVRSFVTGLRSALPPDEESKLTPRLNALADRIQRDWGLKVTTRLSPLIEIVAGGMAEEIYRIVKEGLTNAALHSHGTRAVVEIAVRDNRTLITIEDNGRGFPFDGRLDLPKLVELRRGPMSLIERVTAVRGSLVIDSRHGCAKLEIDVPISLAGVAG